MKTAIEIIFGAMLIFVAWVLTVIFLSFGGY